MKYRCLTGQYDFEHIIFVRNQYSNNRVKDFVKKSFRKLQALLLIFLCYYNSLHDHHFVIIYNKAIGIYFSQNINMLKAIKSKMYQKIFANKSLYWNLLGQKTIKCRLLKISWDQNGFKWNISSFKRHLKQIPNSKFFLNSNSIGTTEVISHFVHLQVPMN